ncbi:MAG: putative baseplate assembly protein [Armatimonadota bacterium]
MSTGRARLPYINKDYDAIRQELLARIPQLTDRWTDFNESDLGIVLLELFAGIGDLLAYYLDAQAAECYLPTARRRQSIIDLCALVNYRLHGPVAATTRVRFTLGQPAGRDLTIPAGTVCRAQGASAPIPFETVTDLVIAAGLSDGEVNARQGERRTEQVSGSGQSFQRIVFTDPGVAQGTVLVTISGNAWQEVEHFADSTPTDHHFRVDRDGLDHTVVLFGDGKYGAIPPTGSAIVITYLITLGPEGNLAPHLITELPSPILVNGQPLSVTVDNPIPATGGADAESHEHARLLAPAVLRSTWKAVTKADYQALCMTFPGVSKAQVLDLNDETSLRIYTVRVVIAPEGGGAPSPQLKADLRAFLEARRMVTIDIYVDEPVYRTVPVSATLYIYPDQDADQVRQHASLALTEHFAFESQTFGRAVYTSDLIALLDGVAGVSHVMLQSPNSDVALAPREIATLGAITLATEVVR